MKVRKIILRDISAYMLQRIEAEVKEFVSKCQVGSIEKLYATTGNSEAYFMISQCNPEWSSLNQIHEKEPELSLLKKLSVMRLVATAMLEIASCGEKFRHGHLHPGNILVKRVDSGTPLEDQSENHGSGLWVLQEVLLFARRLYQRAGVHGA